MADMGSESKAIKVGDWVWWTPAYGRPPEPQRIRFIDACSKPGIKEGVPVEQVSQAEFRNCVFSLENGRWAFGTNLVLLTETEVAQLEQREEAA